MDKRGRLIVGVHITDRVQTVPDVQKVFTEYGCYIRTRLGLHQVQGDYCAPGGLVLLEVIGDPAKSQEMISKLKAITGIDVQQMTFED